MTFILLMQDDEQKVLKNDKCIVELLISLGSLLVIYLFEIIFLFLLRRIRRPFGAP